jgi:hypothetical protein
LKQPLDRHGSGLATFDDRLDDVARQISKPQNPADMGVVQSDFARPSPPANFGVSFSGMHFVAERIIYANRPGVVCEPAKMRG